jgi:hypothetical protein
MIEVSNELTGSVDGCPNFMTILFQLLLVSCYTEYMHASGGQYRNKKLMNPFNHEL